MVSRIKASQITQQEMLGALEKTARQAHRAGQIIQRIRSFVKRSEPNRKAAAELGRHIIDSLLAINPNARVMYMGDLNDDPVNVSLTRFLRATGEKAEAVDGTLYNPMYEPYQRGIGTLAWRDSWNLFDQIVITPSLVTGAGGQYHYYGVRIFNEPYLRQEEGNFAGYPSRTFVGDIYQDGYSDHFPVFLILVKEVKK